MSDRLYFSVPDECDNMLAQRFLLAMIVVAATMMVCSAAYEVVVRIVPWMIGKKRKAWNERNTSTI